MNSERILFMGTPDFAVAILKKLIELDCNIIGVVTQPDKPVGRNQLVAPTPVKEIALKFGIPVLQPIKIGNAKDDIIALNPDCIITCAYGQFIPESILNIPHLGAYNVHASLLPKYRGGAPIHQSIIDGNKVTGISIMRMVKKMDAGDVLSVVQIAIEDTDTMGNLHDKLKIAGAELLAQTLPQILTQTFTLTPQDESEVTFAYNITKEQEFVNFNRDVKVVYDHIRGLTPWPVAYGRIEGRKVKFWQIHMDKGQYLAQPSEVIGLIDHSLAIQAIDGIILCDVLQLEGKGKIQATDFFNGMGKIWVGKFFEEKL